VVVHRDRIVVGGVLRTVALAEGDLDRRREHEGGVELLGHLLEAARGLDELLDLRALGRRGLEREYEATRGRWPRRRRARAGTDGEHERERGERRDSRLASNGLSLHVSLCTSTLGKTAAGRRAREPLHVRDEVVERDLVAWGRGAGACGHSET